MCISHKYSYISKNKPPIFRFLSRALTIWFSFTSQQLQLPLIYFFIFTLQRYTKIIMQQKYKKLTFLPVRNLNMISNQTSQNIYLINGRQIEHITHWLENVIHMHFSCDNNSIICLKNIPLNAVQLSDEWKPLICTAKMSSNII